MKKLLDKRALLVYNKTRRWYEIPSATLREHSSAGRASALQAGGHRFEPCCSHQYLARWCSRLARQPVTLEVDGSSPFRVAILITHLLVRGEEIFSSYASVAQSVEQWTENPRVVGSIPTGGTICGCSSSGRAPPCQGGGSEFEPRHPLQKEIRNAPAFLIS